MCEPTTLMAVGSIASTVVGVYAQQQQGKAQKQVAEYNAKNAENAATRTRNQGIFAQNQQRQKVKQLAANQRAQAAASGVDINTGSALSLQEDTELFGEVDALRIGENYLDQAASLDSQARSSRFAGQVARNSANMNSVGTLLSGASATLNTGVADKWFKPSSARNQVGMLSNNLNSGLA